jgi:hypothetical protein
LQKGGDAPDQLCRFDRFGDVQLVSRSERSSSIIAVGMSAYGDCRHMSKRFGSRSNTPYQCNSIFIVAESNFG